MSVIRSPSCRARSRERSSRAKRQGVVAEQGIHQTGLKHRTLERDRALEGRGVDTRRLDRGPRSCRSLRPEGARSRRARVQGLRLGSGAGRWSSARSVGFVAVQGRAPGSSAHEGPCAGAGSAGVFLDRVECPLASTHNQRPDADLSGRYRRKRLSFQWVAPTSRARPP
jgi:hypothetical protein